MAFVVAVSGLPESRNFAVSKAWPFCPLASTDKQRTMVRPSVRFPRVWTDGRSRRIPKNKNKLANESQREYKKEANGCGFGKGEIK
jgi:hypothetical protein